MYGFLNTKYEQMITGVKEDMGQLKDLVRRRPLNMTFSNFEYNRVHDFDLPPPGMKFLASAAMSLVWHMYSMGKDPLPPPLNILLRPSLCLNESWVYLCTFAYRLLYASGSCSITQGTLSQENKPPSKLQKQGYASTEKKKVLRSLLQVKQSNSSVYKRRGIVMTHVQKGSNELSI